MSLNPAGLYVYRKKFNGRNSSTPVGVIHQTRARFYKHAIPPALNCNFEQFPPYIVLLLTPPQINAS